MRINRTNLALGVALLAFALPAGIAAQTSEAPTADAKYAALESRIAQLESQLNKQQAAKPALVNAALPQTSEGPGEASNPAQAAAAPAPPPDPLAGIKSVLSGVTLTGLVDVYYGYNANHPPQASTIAPGVPGLVGPFTTPSGTITEPFTYRNDRFGLNLIELQLEKTVDKSSPLGFRVALGFGDTMSAINNSSNVGGDGWNSSTQYLKEGYLSYMAPVGKGLQLDFGKYVTPAGAEVIETNQNWNYTRSLLFSFGIPYYHFGARAKYNFSDKVSISGYAANGWNNVVASNSGKTGGFSLSISPTKKITFVENYLTGPRPVVSATDNDHWNNLSDTVLTYNPTGKLSLMANFDYDHQDLGGGAAFDYTGVAGYAKYQFTPKVAFAVRGEYFNDHDGVTLPGFTPQHMWETTGTIERTFASHLIARAEYVHTESNRDVFPYGSSGAFVSGQDTAKIGLVFVLSPAQ